jgi:uncharacterized OB-fold protein
MSDRPVEYYSQRQRAQCRCHRMHRFGARMEGLEVPPEKSRAIDASLFDWPSPAPALKASRCGDCGHLAFPGIGSCRSCGGTRVEVVELPRRGRLWTWTVQRFMPKPPYRSSETEATFRPFGLGYVELPGALRVETRLTESDPGKLQIGAEMELVIYPHSVDDDGTTVMNYAFRPV